jgi:hypothetical protein
MGAPNERVPESGCDSAISGDVCSSDYAGLSKELLTNRIMLWAYAISLVIVALGFVILLLGFAWLSFFYPDKANDFLKFILVGAPALIVLIHNIPNLKKAISNGAKYPNTKS